MSSIQPDSPEETQGIWLDVSKHFYGPAEARLKDNGQLAIWPTGATGPYLSMTVDKWRELLQVITKAIADATAAREVTL
jgi:hypothetical protein